MSLDICVPIFHKNRELFLHKDNQGNFGGSLIALEKNTEVPFRLLVMMDGGTRDDFAVLESYLSGAEYEWNLVHERQPVYYSACVSELFSHVKNKMVALIPPEVTVNDDNWYGKMQLVFMRDPNALVAFADEETPGSLPPHRLPHNFHPEEPMMLMTKHVTEAMPQHSSLFTAKTFAAKVSSWAHGYGGNRWGAPSVRRFVVKGDPHGRRAREKART